MASELERFYRSRAAAGIDGAYGYDNDGNLVERDRKGAVVKTITLPTYRHPTDEELDVMNQTRNEAIAVAEHAVDEARSALYAMSQSVDRDDATMLRLNRAVMEADSKLVHTRFPLMYVNIIDPENNNQRITIRQIDFDQPNNVRRVPYKLAILETRPFTLQEQYVRVGENPEKPLVSVAEVKSRIKAAEKAPVIVFEGTQSDDYGYLSLDWTITIDVNQTTYRSAKQAIYAELAKFFNDQVHLPQILAATTADEVNYSLEDVPGENNAEKWNEQLRRLMYDVNLAKFRQYPELAGKLLETKNAIIGAYLPGDSVIGTGISIENVDAKDSTKWGENILGKALMNIRDVLQAEKPVEEPPVPVPSKKSTRKPTVGSVAPAVPAVPAVPVAPTVVPAAAPLSVPSVAVAPSSATRRKPRVGVKPSNVVPS